MWPKVLLHGLPVAHGEGTDAILVLGLTFLGVALAIGAGVVLGGLARARAASAQPAIGLAVGALLLLFFDLLKESASLGQGLLQQPLLQAALLAAFGLGLLALPWAADRSPAPTRLMWAWLVGLAAHSAGEGWTLGSEASSVDPLAAPLGTLSFLLHKGIEGFTILLIAGQTLSRASVMASAGALAGATFLAGLGGAYLGPSMWTLVFFAAGAGSLASGVAWLSRRQDLSARQAFFVLLGVVIVYAAGLLHEF